jgi:hypothetical protein
MLQLRISLLPQCLNQQTTITSHGTRDIRLAFVRPMVKQRSTGEQADLLAESVIVPITVIVRPSAKTKPTTVLTAKQNGVGHEVFFNGEVEGEWKKLSTEQVTR